MLDIFEYCESKNEEGILLFLDFQKAFDSVNWNFLFKTLEKFNFGPQFLKWLKILYKNPIFRIKNNGWISKTCSMKRGIRQGCPISAIIFLFVVEIMSLKIKTAKNIKGFTNDNMNTEIRLLQHADDASLPLLDVKSMENAIILINDFSKVSGMRLNMKKTEAILLGPLKNRYTTLYDVKITNDPVRCLGIYIGHDIEKCYEKNWIEKIHKLEKMLNMWKKRKLTLFGKCSIINTLALTQLYYSAIILNYPNTETLKNIQRLIFKFIWGKRDRIKRNTLIGNIADGGIGIVDVESKFKSLKAMWIKRLSENKSTIRIFFESIIHKKSIDLAYLLKTSNTNIYDFENAFNKLPKFYCEVLCAFNECKLKEKICISDKVLTQPIWFNTNFRTNKHSLFFANWAKVGILYVKDLFNQEGKFHDIEYFSDVIKNKSNWICEYNVLKKTFKHLEKIQNMTKCKFINITNNKKFLLNNKENLYPYELKCKTLYKIFIAKKFVKPYYERKWTKIFNLNFQEYRMLIYSSKIIKLKDKQLSEFNFKILHNLLNNNKSVSMWNKNVSEKCNYCFLIEDVKHLIFDCKNVKRIWEVARNVCQINIQWKHIVVGYFLVENRNTQLFNLLISVIAFLIYKIKMKLRFEQRLESDMEINIYVKNNLLYYYEIYKKLETRLNVKLFHELSICL